MNRLSRAEGHAPAADPAIHANAPASDVRTVLTGDGVAWIEENPLPPSHAIVTSLPDVSEMRSRDLAKWRTWFVDTAALLCARAADEAPVLFFQTDVKHDGRWIDKGHLVAAAAERAGSECLFHKIVCRAPAGRATYGRPGFAHLLAFSRTLRVSAKDATADVLPDLGEMTWTRATGTAACEEACRFVLRSSTCRTVVDPFCGAGTVLAVANALGLAAIGVERSPKRAERARHMRFVPGRGIV